MMKTISKIVVKIVFLSLMLVCTASVSKAAIYYVSSTGNDANSGLTTALPWKTITKVNSVNFNAGDQILFKRGGTWYGTLDLHWRFGSSTNPITYGAYGTGARPIITGFTSINSGWTNEGGGVYSKVITSESQTNMVLIDGVQYAMGRTPNTGSYLIYETVLSKTSIQDNQLTGVQSWIGAEAAIFMNGWEIDRCLVTGQSAGVITYTNLAGTNTADISQSTGKYFFQNSLQTLDVYGEWFHDYSGTRKLYVYFGTADPATKIVKVATLDNLLKAISGEDYTTIRNISFEGSAKDALNMHTTNNYMNILSCDISYAGLDALYIDGLNGKVDSCNISNINRVAVKALGTNTLITNNVIGRIGIPEAQGSVGYYKGAIWAYGENITISYNDIDMTGYCGVICGNSSLYLTVNYNFIKNTCQNRWDYGSIYLGYLNRQSAPRTLFIVDHNIIIGSKGAGIYLDEYTNNMTATNNTISGCEVMGIKIHKSSGHSVTNNTVFDCATGIGLLNWTSEYCLHHQTVKQNIVVAKTAAQRTFNYTDRYPQYVTSLTSHNLNNNYYARPIDDNTTIRKVYPSLTQDISLSGWKSQSGQDLNSNKSVQSITSENDLRFEYNATKTAKTITLSQPMIDVKGTKYASSVTLQPYTSVVLMKDAKPTKYSTEYKSICDGLNYNGWTTTGKYERTLLAKTGADSIVTTYLTVNPKYAVQENVTIQSGQNYKGWTSSGTYTRTLASAAGCDSVITTLLTVENSAVKVITTQTIALKKGTNMISTYLQATNPDVSVVTQTIRDSGNLIKLQSETGSSYENWGILGGWINNLGSLQNTEGYKIMVANDCAIQITGTQIALPLNIPLNVGWNIISFPRADILDAKMIVQSLIDQNVLVKVQDEIGNSIEDWGIAFGGWKNGIGNFQPGKAYRVKVSANSVLTIKDIYPKSAILPVYDEPATRFQSVAVGNGSDHMNINLVGLKETGLSAGDELAAYDGNICVGTLKITDQHIMENSASLAASCSTDNLHKDGFDEGSSIYLRIWKPVSGLESGISVSVLHGTMTYSKNGSMFGKMPSLTTLVSDFAEETQIEVYPNPSQGRFTVRFSDIPKSGSRIDILDLSGRKVASQVINGISEEFNLFGQAAGMYLVKSVIGSVEKINKLVIQ